MESILISIEFGISLIGYFIMVLGGMVLVSKVLKGLSKWNKI